MKIDIKKLRKDLLFTQEEFARFVGVDRVSVSLWESRHSTPSIKHLKKIKTLCELYGLRLEDYENI